MSTQIEDNKEPLFQPASTGGGHSRYFLPPNSQVTKDGVANDDPEINLDRPERPLRVFWVTSVRDVGGDDGVNLKWDPNDATTLLKGSLHALINAINDELKGYVEIVGVAVDDVPDFERDENKLTFTDPNSNVSATYSILPKPDDNPEGTTWIAPYALVKDAIGLDRIVNIPSTFRTIPASDETRRDERAEEKYKFEAAIAEKAREFGADMIHSDHLMVILGELFQSEELGFAGRVTNQHPGIAYKGDPDRLPGATPTLDALERFRGNEEKGIKPDPTKNRTGAAFHFIDAEPDGGENIFDTAGTVIYDGMNRQDVRISNYNTKHRGLTQGLKYLAANFAELVNGNLASLGLSSKVEPLKPDHHISLEFVAPNDDMSNSAKKKLDETLFNLVNVNAVLRGFAATRKRDFNKLLENGGHPLKYQLVYERSEPQVDPVAIGYCAYSPTLDRKGRKSAIIHELYTIDGRRTPEITKAILGKVAAETNAEKLMLGIADDDRLGQIYLEQAVNLGAKKPASVVSFDATRQARDGFGRSAKAFTRRFKAEDVELLKDFSTASGSPLLDPKFDFANLTSADVKTEVVITFSDDSEERLLGVTVLNRDLSLMTTAEIVEAEHTRTPEGIEYPERLEIVPSVLDFVRSDEQARKDLGLVNGPDKTEFRWNVAKFGSHNDGNPSDKTRATQLFSVMDSTILGLSRAIPPRQVAVLSNGDLKDLAENWERNASNISVANNRVRVTHVPTERARLDAHTEALAERGILSLSDNPPARTVGLDKPGGGPGAGTRRAAEGPVWQI